MSAKESQTKPFINVTPLIDVLLVLLIIFMVAAPAKPHKFNTKLPAPPDGQVHPPNDLTLLVAIESDGKLRLNGLTQDMGTIDDPTNLLVKLTQVLDERTKNRVYRYELLTRTDLPESTRIQKTVFIKAPRTISYGEVARLIDGIKGTGADPIGLQLDDLKN